MSYTEDLLIAGTSYNASTRYGDYSHLVGDPDGVTFWFTCEYNNATTWSTRAASFTLDPCASPNCGNATNLNSTNLTNTAATVNWTAVSGALNYDVDYKQTATTTWVNLATATILTSANLTGLLEGVTYDWRVRANCTAGVGNYVAAQFTTTTPCAIPVGLTFSNITSTVATLSWTAVANATSYTVLYKQSTVASYTVLPSVNGTSTNLTGLLSGIIYNWSVSSNCSVGVSSNYSADASFTTINSCADPYEPNNTYATATAITPGSYNATISTSTDNDYFKFNNTTALKNIKVTLSNLPADYDLRLYRPNGTIAGSSANAGTANETIIFNSSTIGTYTVYVYGYNGVFSTSACYTLLVQISGTKFAPEAAAPENNQVEILKMGGLKVFPVPASGKVNI